jgi:plasmid stabilization system protein ParE
VAWRVVWTEPGWSNLEAAADYIAQDSPRYASSLVREARDASRSLGRFANRGRLVPEIGDPNVRELFVWRYRLIYRVADQQVEILAFIHSARDPAAALKT